MHFCREASAWQRGTDLCLPTGDGSSQLKRRQVPPGTNHCLSTFPAPADMNLLAYPLPVHFLAGLSANKWPKAYVQEQAQNNARGTAPANGSQPGIASRQLAGGCGHLLHLQLRGDPARLLGRKPPWAGSISPKFRCLQSAAEQVGQGPF